MSEASVITCANVTKVFSTQAEELAILQDITIETPRGSSVSITGPSGCGKSTLLSLLGGLDKPTGGSIMIEDFPVHSANEIELAQFRAKKLGLIFQFHFLLKDFTALENVMMPHLILNGNKKHAHETAREMLSAVGLQNRLHHYPEQLSGGERQRVAIARALINRPCVVLADEPTGNLDESNAEIIETLLLDTVKHYGATLVLVTHDIEFAKRTDTQFRIHEGKLYSL